MQISISKAAWFRAKISLVIMRKQRIFIGGKYGGNQMLIDMHMHEMRYSGDSFLKLEIMVELAKARGLDAICITDHDNMGIRDFAEEYSEKTGFPIFTGIEFFSLQGDIVAMGIKEYPRERIPAQEFITMVKEQGGMCFSAHPFRNNNRGLEVRSMMRIKRLRSTPECWDWQRLVLVIVMYRRSWDFMRHFSRKKFRRLKSW